MSDNMIKLFIEGQSENRINPLLYRNDVDAWLMGCIYQGMMMYDEEIKLTHRLTKSVIHNNDYTIFQITLKDNLIWTDGVPITSNDIKFTINMILHPKADYWQTSHFQNIDNMVIIDSKNLLIKLKKADSLFNQRLLLPIIPCHVFSEIGIDSFFNNTHNDPYIGCGPYKLIKKDNGEFFFERNNDFHLGKPKIKNMLIKTGSTEDLIKLIKEKSIDFATIPKNIISTINEDLSNYDLYALDKPEITYVTLNHRNHYLSQKVNRQLICSAVNKDKLINNAYSGMAENITQYYPNILSEYRHGNLNQYNLEIKEMETKDIQLKIGFYEQNYEHEIIANNIKEDLMKIGIFVHIIKYKDKHWEQDFFDKKLDMFVITQSILISPNPSFALGENSKIRKGMGWNDKTNLKLIDRGIKEKNNKKIYKEWSKYINEELPMIFLCSPSDVQIISKRITNIEPSSRGLLWNIHHLEIHDEVLK